MKSFIKSILPPRAIKIIRNIKNGIKMKYERKKVGFKYSREWYEEFYHKKDYKLNQKKYNEVMEEWEKLGYKKRLYEVLEQIDIFKNNTNLNILEVGCHHGKTAFWTLERFKNVYIYMFDFSNTAINWIKKYNPFSDRTTIWYGDIQHINYKNMDFNDFFDLVFFLDVSEHLPEKVYINGLKEIYRVVKKNGFVLSAQGISILPEHINIRTESQYIKDHLSLEFKLIKVIKRFRNTDESLLPHYLFQK